MAATRAGRHRHVYDRTSGYCHLCGKKLSLKNYGKTGARGAWHLEHSRPRARGGTDHANNLYPGCIPCNTSKRDRDSRTFRAQKGMTRAPLSRIKRRTAQRENTLGLAAVGTALGAVLGGPLGAAIGGGVGALVGKSIKVK